MNALVIGTCNIREQDGLFSLNDLHRAAGGEAKHEPNQYMRLDQTRALVAELKSADSRNYEPVKSVRGRFGGTYACRELVIAYAAWISAAFHLKVIRVFLGQTAKKEPQAPSLLNRRWLVSYDLGGERAQEVPPDACVMRPSDLPGLLADAGFQIAPDVVAQIGAACMNRLAGASAVRHQPPRPALRLA